MYERLRFPTGVIREPPPPRLTLEQYLDFLNFTMELSQRRRDPAPKKSATKNAKRNVGRGM